MSEDTPLSIVIPAYNEQARITMTLRRTLDYLAVHHPDTEVIVVDDGSDDDTCALVEELQTEATQLSLIRLGRNRGKGAAVRTGVLDARGAHVLFMDADLATPIEELDKLLRYARQGYDVVIGSRALADSDIRARQPLPRELMGRTFNLIVRSLLLGGFKDTQCGFKLFTRDVARDLFGAQTLDGFAFDVEILLLARERGYRIREVPVIWYHAPNSQVSPVTDASRMFVDLVKMRLGRLGATVIAPMSGRGEDKSRLARLYSLQSRGCNGERLSRKGSGWMRSFPVKTLVRAGALLPAERPCPVILLAPGHRGRVEGPHRYPYR